MKSAWVEREAKQAVDRYGKAGIAADLALRLYSTRLLGRDPKLVLHGGGNSSLKTTERDLAGEKLAVLRVKGSGWDMGAIEPGGFPAVRLEPLRALRARKTLSDDAMARVQRAYLIDPQAPSPSVEMLLHAFMPAKFIDHTHATAVLSLIDQPNAAELCAEVFGGRLGFVPYRMPGFGLAKEAAAVFDKNPKVEGLILDKHGIFTFGVDARESYERMIAFVSRAENRLRKQIAKRVRGAKLPQRIAAAIDVAPIVRGVCTLRDAGGEGAHKRPILAFRTGDAILDFVNGKDVARYARAGVITPDHVIRVKPWPLILAAPQDGKLAGFQRTASKAAQKFIDSYRAYFARHKARAHGAAMHDPAPRVVLVPGLGLFGLGASAKDAGIAADIAQAAVEGITGAEAIGRFTSISPADMFDCEYWPLELAKLGARKELPLAGQVAVVTGAGGAIGAATAQTFAAAGAEVALLDLDAGAARRQAEAIGGSALALKCDVTDAASVRDAFKQVVAAFGGVDIAISNAGAAWQGKIGEVDEATITQKLRIEFLRAPESGASRGQDHAGAGHRRLPLVQRVETGGQSGRQFRPLRTAQGGDLVPGAPIRARLRRRRHPRQRGQCRPHPLRPAHRRLHRATRQGAGLKRERLYERQSASARSHRAGRGASLSGAGAGAQDHRRRHHRGRRKHCGGAAIKCYRDSGSRTVKGATTMLRPIAVIGLLPLLLLASPASAAPPRRRRWRPANSAPTIRSSKAPSAMRSLKNAWRRVISSRPDAKRPRSRPPRNRWRRNPRMRRRPRQSNSAARSPAPT